MKTTGKRLWSTLLALCLLLTLLPGPTLAAGDAGEGGPSSIGAPAEPEEPGLPEGPEGDMEADALAVSLFSAPSVAADGTFVYANGIPIVIKADGGGTYIYDSTGQDKLLDRDVSGHTIIGGSKQAPGTEVGDTSIVMESGQVAWIYGGDLYSCREGDTSVVVTGGKVYAICGGSFGSDGDTAFGQLDGDTSVELSGGQVNFVFGGGYTAGTSVSGTASIHLKAGAQVTPDTGLGVGSAVYGGAQAGTVGNTRITVDGGVAVVSALFGGGAEPTSQVTGQAAIEFGGNTSQDGWIHGGPRSGSVGDVEIILNDGASLGNTVWAGGQLEDSTVRSTRLILAGAQAGYVYGGSEFGQVTGDVVVDVARGGVDRVWAGGYAPSSGVGGDTTVNAGAPVRYVIAGAGYEGPVDGSAQILLDAAGWDQAELPLLSGSSNNAALDLVAGGTALTISGTPAAGALTAKDDIRGFDTITLSDTVLRVDGDVMYQNTAVMPQDLVLTGNTVLGLVTGGLAVAGGFSGGGTVELWEGFRLSVAGEMTGTTALKLKPAPGSSSLGSPVAVASGPKVGPEWFELTEPVDYTLRQKGDQVLAYSGTAVELTITGPDQPLYGDPLPITVQAGRELTALTLTVRKESGQQVWQETMATSGGKAAFGDLGRLEAGRYVLTAEVRDQGLYGSAVRPLEIGKRPLTLSDPPAFSRTYEKGTVDVWVPATHFQGCTLTGYLPGDSGGIPRLTEGDTLLYRMTTPGAGTGKEAAPAFLQIPLTDYPDPADEAQEKAAQVYRNYTIQPPALAIHITPLPIASIVFASELYNYPVGTPLSQRPLVGGSIEWGVFSWKDPDYDPPVGTADVEAVFTPFDLIDHDFSGVEGWDPATQTVVRTLSVHTIKREKPADGVLSKTCAVGDTDRAVTLSLTGQPVGYPADAGGVRYSYTGSGDLGGLRDVKVEGDGLGFTIPGGTPAGATVPIPITVSSDLYADSTLTVKVVLTEKTVVEIGGISLTGLTEARKTYDGLPVGYTGDPDAGAYTGDLVYTWTTADGVLLGEAPKDSGTYILAVQVPDSDPTYTGRLELAFEILLARLEVKAEDRKVAVGAPAPSYTAVIQGLAPGEQAQVEFDCAYTQGSGAGTYPITPKGIRFQQGDPGNYRVAYLPGALTAAEQYRVTVENGQGGGDYFAGDTVTVTADPAPSGRKFTGWSADPGVDLDDSGSASASFPMPACPVTLTALYASTSSGGGGSTSTTTKTVKNPDGSTTTIKTNKATGTVTETTKYPDGTVETVETKKDGTVTETVKGKDGSTSQTVTRADGSVGYEAVSPDGVKVEAETDPHGKTTASAVIPEKALKAGGPVTLPLPAVKAERDAGGAATIAITVPQGETARVEVPVADMGPGVVALLVRADGGESVVMTAIPTEGGLLVEVKGEAVFKIVDGAKSFLDVPEDHWGAASIQFAAARGLFSGTGPDTYDPDSTMTRAMLWTVLARMDGQTGHGGETWYEKGMEWAVARGVSDGADPAGALTREQFVTMLWRYAGSPAAGGSLEGFPDRGAAGAFAVDALGWAVGAGVIQGVDGGRLDPGGSATRAEAAAILTRFLCLTA